MITTSWSASSPDRDNVLRTVELETATAVDLDANHWRPDVVAVVTIGRTRVGLTVAELEELSAVADRMSADARREAMA